MNTVPTLTLLFVVSSLLLSSCSTVKDSIASASDSLSAVRDKALGAPSGKLQLTKADPNRFLPANTDANKVRVNPVVQQRRFLAKNNRAKAQLRVKRAEEVTAETSPYELPPLPEFVEGDDASDNFSGILPSLNDSEEATYIEVDGKTPELPPLPTEEELLLAETQTSES